MLSSELQQDLVDFASGWRPWEQWPRWLAINARGLSREFSATHMRGLRTNTREQVAALLAELGITYEPVDPTDLPGHIRIDPIENDPQLKPLVEAAAKEAEAELQPPRDGHEMGMCHHLWRRQKEILRERHGIDWRSPAEMNPDIIFD